MLNKISDILKRVVAGLLCTICLSTAILQTIPLAYAKGSDVILGTNAALGSPILNNNFTINDWNKWEMICWGVFLSNFCVPLVDDYESCFMTGKGGSNGSGYKALCFGTGNDPTNNETIEALTTYAAVQQKVTQKEIYVMYSDIDEGSYKSEPLDPNDSQDNADKMRPARFKDFFFDTKDDGTTGGSTWGTLGQSNWMIYYYDTGGVDYKKVGAMNKGSVPTFYIRNGSNKYVKIFDYRDSWDAQMVSAILNAVNSSGHRMQDESEFNTKYEEYMTNNTAVSMDSFGNITVNGKVFIPAAVNKHITRDEDINLMNSWIINGYSSTYSNKQLVLGLKQDIQSSIDGWDNTWDRRGGYPAFGGSSFGGIGLLYYDTDTIQINNNINNGSYLQYGELLTELFSTDINSTKSSYNLKFEISDNIEEKTRSWFSYNPDLVDQTRYASSMLANININGTANKKILNYIVDMYGNKLDLYSDDGVVAPVMLNTAKTNEVNKASASRMYYNFLYEIWTGNKSTYNLKSQDLREELPSMNWSQFKEQVSTGTSVGKWFKGFQAAYTEYSKLGVMSVDDFWDFNSNDTVSKEANRLVKVYPVSDQMRAIAQIFGCRDGTEFRQYSTMIYMTYLDFYGIASDTSATGAKTKSSGFNPEIYDESSDLLNVDLNDVIDTMSDEELEEEVLYYSYLMLHPERGREYRQQLIENSVTDWIYEQYNRIVYGGYNENYSGSTSKSNSGFLSIETYTDNFLTSWFLNGYVEIAVWLLGIGTLIIIILGIIQHKKFSWFVLSVLLVVNCILLVPSSGEIVPYVTSNMIQNMFSSKMTYWSISQGISNAKIESDANPKQTSGYMQGMTPEEANAVMSIVKQLSVIYTDRSLMVKQDISQKITQMTTGAYSDIQSIQSARWILPMVMQQFTGDNNSTDYIYKPLANIWDDMSNTHWYFKPLDAQSTEVESHTATSDQNAVSVEVSDYYNDLTNGYYFEDFDTQKSLDKVKTDINCRSYAYSLNAVEELSHVVFTYLPDNSRRAISINNSIGIKGTNYKDVDSWKLYIDDAVNHANKAKWITNRSGGFEETADSYDRNVRDTIKDDMPYLLSTESPAYYFYNLIKDTFPIESNLGSIIGQLQGQIKKDAEGNEVRANFMYATIGDESQPDSVNFEYTGYVRDVLDLEELFYNVIPYLYEMQLTAGGFNGVSGILDDEKITDELKYYEGNMQSWMYRCNWATKIMENPDYSEGYNVGKASGDKAWVPNPALASSYPDDRPMVFSEAQKQAMGLDDSDLTIVELKCIEANEKVAKQWTLLINYAGAAGLTKEVLLRQMATDATLIFCNEFSSSGVINTMYTMYPQSLDLRYISFDSVMKMLIMNVSKNTSYIYSDTMSTLIEDTDMITAIFLLVDAYLCAYIIPFVRTALMAMIFFLGFLAILRALLSSGKYKAKIACGQFVMNVVFMIYTLCYYAVFSISMALTSNDEVLTTSNFSSSAGNPVWILIIIALAGGVYTTLMIKQIIFCWKHKRDMGFEAMSIMASGIVGHISDAMGTVGNKVQNFFNSESNQSSYSTSNTNSIKGTGAMQQEAQEVNLNKASSGTLKVTKDDDMKDNVFMDAEYAGNYNNLSEIENIDSMQAAEIDAEIEKGEELKID